MSTININNCNYYYEIKGSGKETLVFSHGLLWSCEIFKKQIEYFKSKYSILIYDHCEHGQSEILDENIKSRSLHKDIIQLLDYLNLKQVHFIGLSMGADVAIRVALERPNLIKSLILMSVSVKPEPKLLLKHTLLNNVIRFSGIKFVLPSIMVNMFSMNFLNDPKRKDEVKKWETELLKNKKNIHTIISSSFKRNPFNKNILQNISCPTLIIAGTEDKATPIEDSKFVNLVVKNSILSHIDGCGHMVCIEAAETCNIEIELFLNQFN